jgi:hypothetical protein
MKKQFTVILIFFLSIVGLYSQTPRVVDSKDFAVLLSAEVSENPPQIKLKWSKNELALQYRILRKTVNDKVWTSGILATLDSSATEYIDKTVIPSVAYEYEIQAISLGSNGTANFTFWGFGYIMTGINIPEYDNPGNVLLLIDTTLIDKLKPEILRLKKDLRAEGWGIIEKYVPRVEKFSGVEVKKVKSIIAQEYAKDPQNLKSIYILGRVAVPYSGNLNPDGHGDHIGAWPADIYYGYSLPDEYWTDVSVNSTAGSRSENKNIPGDGKFDVTYQSLDDAKLAVGRVDLYGMKLFHSGLSDPEVDLIRKYLNKNHRYRSGEMTYTNSGIIDDNFGAASYVEAFASSGWRNIAVLTAPDKVRKADWFTTLGTESHLFAYGCGGGTYTSAGGVGTTTDFSTKPVNAVFTFLFGSYFGDWDIENSFLRAPLASDPMALTCAWVARPHWYFHHMAYGYPIGYSALQSHNNLDLYKPNVVYSTQYPNGVIYAIGMKNIHTALMGDPTLKLNPATVPSATNVSTYQQKDNDGKPIIKITWKKPTSNKSFTFNIYRSTSEFGLYKKLNTSPVTSEEFIDNLSGAGFTEFDGQVYYMIRTVMTETINSGIAKNCSLGEISNLFVTDVADESNIETSMNISPNPASDKISVEFNISNSGLTKIDVIDMNGKVIAEIFNGYLSAGNQFASWNLRDNTNQNVSNGVYLIRLQSPKQILVKQVSIIK